MAISDDVNVSYNIDYRSKKDDAWYTCGVVLEDGKKLRLKLKDFVESYNDEVFSISDFSNHHEIDEFLRRFRSVCEPIEENECSRVIEGMLVCATYTGDGSVRYFDALVDAVQYKEHTPEKCICTYLLFWQHGPDEGNITAASLDDIYLIFPGAVDSRVADFAKLAREKLRGDSSQSNMHSKRRFFSTKRSSNETPIQEFGSNGQSFCVGFSEGRRRFYPQISDQDIDLGGVKETGHHHYIIVENLEKDLSPLLMAEFIHKQTSLMAKAYVFPSLLIETYARGAIVLESKTKLKRIYEFISNPNRFIVSSSGRPWVIPEDTLFNTNLQVLEPKFEDKSSGSELLIVRLGSAEYNQAKRAKDLYMEFRNHMNGLFHRLDREEKKILYPSGAN